MNAESARSHLPRPSRQFEDPPECADRFAIPDSRPEECDASLVPCAAGRLWREGDKVMYRSADGGEPETVRVVWVRPLSERGGPLSIMLAGKKRELAYLPSLDALDAASRVVALEELAGGMVLPRITAIHLVRPRFGNYYWDVETDMGRRKFLLYSPESNSFRPGPDAIVVKDAAGNCYEINPVSGLDAASRKELDRVL